jgi:hypothetical protein
VVSIPETYFFSTLLGLPYTAGLTASAKATASLADQPPLKLRRSAEALAKAEALRAKAEGLRHVEFSQVSYPRCCGLRRTAMSAFSGTATGTGSAAVFFFRRAIQSCSFSI